MFSIGDIVMLNGRSSHVGYVKEVLPTKTQYKGELPTFIVEWFSSNTPFHGAPTSWHFEDELTKVEATSEAHEKVQCNSA
jgi:hypothetical protein